MRPALRLRHQRDFARLRTQGQTVQHRLLKLSYAPSQLNHNRYGFIVSGRLGNAVERNRLRRRLKDIVRQLHPQIDCHSYNTVTSGQASVGVDCVFIVHRAAMHATFADLQTAVQSTLRRAQLLKKDTAL